MEHDGFVAQKNKGGVSGKERDTAVLDKAPPINGKGVVFCFMCKTSNVWTKKKCIIGHERIPSWFFRFHGQASEEQRYVRYESSSSDESIGIVFTHDRIVAERDRKQEELGGKVSEAGRSNTRSRRAAHRASCSRGSESGAFASYDGRLAREAFG